jgi:hypothetical protein
VVFKAIEAGGFILVLSWQHSYQKRERKISAYLDVLNGFLCVFSLYIHFLYFGF